MMVIYVKKFKFEDWCPHVPHRRALLYSTHITATVCTLGCMLHKTNLGMFYNGSRHVVILAMYSMTIKHDLYPNQ